MLGRERSRAAVKCGVTLPGRRQDCTTCSDCASYACWCMQEGNRLPINILLLLESTCWSCWREPVQGGGRGKSRPHPSIVPAQGPGQGPAPRAGRRAQVGLLPLAGRSQVGHAHPRRQRPGGLPPPAGRPTRPGTQDPGGQGRGSPGRPRRVAAAGDHLLDPGVLQRLTPRRAGPRRPRPRRAGGCRWRAPPGTRGAAAPRAPSGGGRGCGPACRRSGPVPAR